MDLLLFSPATPEDPDPRLLKVQLFELNSFMATFSTAKRTLSTGLSQAKRRLPVQFCGRQTPRTKLLQISLPRLLLSLHPPHSCLPLLPLHEQHSMLDSEHSNGSGKKLGQRGRQVRRKKQHRGRGKARRLPPRAGTGAERRTASSSTPLPGKTGEEGKLSQDVTWNHWETAKRAEKEMPISCSIPHLPTLTHHIRSIPSAKGLN